MEKASKCNDGKDRSASLARGASIHCFRTSDGTRVTRGELEELGDARVCSEDLRDARGTRGHTGNSPNNASETRKGTALSRSADGDTLPQRVGRLRAICESRSVVDGDEMEGRNRREASLKASKSIAEKSGKVQRRRRKALSKVLRSVAESAGNARGRRREGREEKA